MIGNFRYETTEYLYEHCSATAIRGAYTSVSVTLPETVIVIMAHGNEGEEENTVLKLASILVL